MGTEFDEGRETLDRRQAIKKAAVGAAAAGVVWSAPKVQGLSLRPNYAAATSAGGGQGTADVVVPITFTQPPSNRLPTSGSAPLGNGNIVISAFTSSDIANGFAIGAGYVFNGTGTIAAPAASQVVGTPNDVMLAAWTTSAWSANFAQGARPNSIRFSITCN